MDKLKRKIEAILFSVGRYISLEEISKLCKSSEEKCKGVLTELKVDYKTKESSLTVISDENMWKLATKEEYSSVVRKVVTETELTKSQLETLAVIAFKYPIKQSDLIRIRTNKAYDHISELEASGFVTRQKYGRSKLIKLTDKFFEYFDLPYEKLKDRFKGFEQLAKTIEDKESDVKKAKEQAKIIVEEEKKVAEQEKKLMDGQLEIDLVNEIGQLEPLEVVDEENKTKEIDSEKESPLKVGKLNVYGSSESKKEGTQEAKEDDTDKE